jgi:hypothetical protein
MHVAIGHGEYGKYTHGRWLILRLEGAWRAC